MVKETVGRAQKIVADLQAKREQCRRPSIELADEQSSVAAL
jgi:hypothetical protein